jgi:hypothetical protein
MKIPIPYFFFFRSSCAAVRNCIAIASVTNALIVPEIPAGWSRSQST